MAGGWKRPISEIKVGDKVLATDPKPGETSLQKSSAVITGTGARDLVQLTLARPRRGGTAVGSAECAQAICRAPAR
ncbi:hypothetical protein [Streptomyces goshikiensis]|uniref:hypothetical protein n=1 Tax=Streptomyces goshikiensis TaxID=1942 RepID=UPI002E135FF9|nr:hypothetical protein OG224_01775 [Streptomyces goshikiensis]